MTLDEHMEKHPDCEHASIQDALDLWDKHGQTVTLRIDGDAFVQDLTCAECGLRVEAYYVNKDPDCWVVEPEETNAV